MTSFAILEKLIYWLTKFNESDEAKWMAELIQLLNLTNIYVSYNYNFSEIFYEPCFSCPYDIETDEHIRLEIDKIIFNPLFVIMNMRTRLGIHRPFMLLRPIPHFYKSEKFVAMHGHKFKLHVYYTLNYSNCMYTIHCTTQRILQNSYGKQLEIFRQCCSVFFILAIKKFGIEASNLK